MKLIIFDFDGPINDLIEAKRKAIKDLSEQLKISFSDNASWSLINYIDQIYEIRKIHDYKELVTLSLEKLEKNDLLKLEVEQKSEFASRFKEVLYKQQKVNPNLFKDIQTIRKNDPAIKICIYTSQKEEDVTKFLGEFKTHFDKIYGRDYFDEPKPSVTNLIKIGNEFGISPKETIVFGDNVAVDLAPASYLGMKTILVNKFVSKTISSLEELESVLK